MSTARRHDLRRQVGLRPWRALLPLLGAGLALASGCFESQTTRCSWGRLCPEGLVCDEVARTCIHPSQTLLCRDRLDGEPCQPAELASGLYLCLQGVCRRSQCGDGIRDPRPGAAEACDDGNTKGGDGCRADCRGLEVCGDGMPDPLAGEACDDGNLDDGDQCTRLCAYPVCGDGLLSGLEECDDGAGNSDTVPDACRVHCIRPGCGDGVVDSADRTACWEETATLTTSDSPTLVRAADLDGDGLTDLAVFSPSVGRLNLYLAQGDGAFAPAVGSPLLLGTSAKDFTLGDLTGDGAAEVVVTRNGGAAVQVYLNHGDGAMTPQTPTGLSRDRVWRPIVTDWNGDGHADVAALDEGTCSLLLVQGDGTGALSGESFSDVSPGGCSVERLAAADFDGDQIMDFVIGTYSDGVIVAQGDGLGNASVPSTYPVWSAGTVVRDVAVGDFDGDGLPDVAYPEQRPPQTPVRIWLNRGGFTFVESAASPVLLGVSSLKMATGDLDGDGRPDLVFCDYYASATFLLFGRGDGSFTVLTQSATLAQPFDAVAAGDFDGDPFHDIALLNVGEDRLSIFRSTP